MASTNQVWEFQMGELNQDRSSFRGSLGGGEATYMVAGVDGSVEGEMRVFPGLYLLDTLNPDDASNHDDGDAPTAFSINRRTCNGVTAPNQPLNSGFPWVSEQIVSQVGAAWYIGNIFPVNFAVGADREAYGIVYEVENTYNIPLSTGDNQFTTDEKGIHIRYTLDNDPNFYEREIRRGIPTGALVEVTTFGRFIFVMVEGQQPSLFYLKDPSITKLKHDASATVGHWSLALLGQFTGHIEFDATAADIETAIEALDGVETNDVSVTVNGSTFDASTITTITWAGKFKGAPPTVTITTHGTHTDSPDPETSAWDGGAVAVHETDRINGIIKTQLGDAADNLFEEIILNSPSNLTPPGPGFRPTLHEPGTSSPGTYGSSNFDMTLQFTADSEAWLDSEPSTNPSGLAENRTAANVGFVGPNPYTTEDDRQLVDGDYAFAYQLFDSETGRLGPLSTIAPVEEGEEDSWDATPVNQYFFIDISYLTARYDKVIIYRSPRTADIGAKTASALMFVDAVVLLADYHWNNAITSTTVVWDDLPSGVALSRVYFTLEDKQLYLQDPYLERPRFDPAMPSGGAAIVYDGSMLIGGISKADNAYADFVQGVGELRWSSPVEPNLELFSPSHVFYPDTMGSKVIRFAKVGEIVIGFARDRQYRIRKEGPYFAMEDMHVGYGIRNSRAVAVVGQMAYFISPNGLKAVDSRGQREDVRSVNQFILDKWASDLAVLELSYCARGNVLYVHNSNAEEMLCLWFNTGRVTMLHDATWDHIESAKWPEDNSNNFSQTNRLIDRTLFVHNVLISGSVGPKKGRVYAVDYARDVKNSITLLPIQDEGASSVVVAKTRETVTAVSAFLGNTSLIIIDIAGTLPISVGTTAVGWGAFIYFHDGPAAGRRIPIGARVSATRIGIDLADSYNPDSGYIGGANQNLIPTPEVGDTFSIGPVRMELVLPSLNPQSVDGQQLRDDFVLKHVDVLGVHFVGVTDHTIATYGGTSVDHQVFAQLQTGDSETNISEEDVYKWTPTLQEAGSEVATVIEGAPNQYIAFGSTAPTSFHSGSRFGVKNALIFPAIRIAVSGLDYKVLAVRIKGSVQESVLPGSP